MSAAVITIPPSAVRRSEICSQRPSAISTCFTPGRSVSATVSMETSATFCTRAWRAPGFSMRGSSAKKLR